MSRRVLIGFVLLNVLVSVAVALAIIRMDDWRREDAPAEGPTQIVLITTTPHPGLQPAEYQGTIDVQQLTLGALLGQAAVVSVITATPEEGLTLPQVTAVATIDPMLLPPIPTDLPPGMPTPTTEGNDGCLRHVVESGDYVLSIAQKYGVFPGDVLRVNQLDEDHILRIGQVLLIPVSGCAALITPSPVPTATNTPFSLRAATVTPPRSSGSDQVTIRTVMNWGNVNSEAVELRNDGPVVDLRGWTLSSGNDEIFRFPEFRMQQGSVVRIFSKQGENTPAALYWGRETAAWRSGDTITLNNDSGQVQASFRIGG